jgi:hypothetical protein
MRCDVTGRCGETEYSGSDDTDDGKECGDEEELGQGSGIIGA